MHLADHRDTDDFFFVTDDGLYQGLLQRGYHVVLQDNQRATDDGSLSVFCGKRGIPYVTWQVDMATCNNRLKCWTPCTTCSINDGRRALT